MAAIGGSAGGIEAISQFLTHLQPNLGLVYVIIQHLSPDHSSILPSLLEKRTSMKVHQVKDGMKVEPDNVYVIPPATCLQIASHPPAEAPITIMEVPIIIRFKKSYNPPFAKSEINFLLLSKVYTFELLTVFFPPFVNTSSHCFL